MKTAPAPVNSYIIDTYKSSTGKFCAGAITFAKRKKMDVIHWTQRQFDTLDAANNFVRSQFRKDGLTEMENEGELFKANAR